jgi:hypothetical protein
VTKKLEPLCEETAGSRRQQNKAHDMADMKSNGGEEALVAFGWPYRCEQRFQAVNRVCVLVDGRTSRVSVLIFPGIYRYFGGQTIDALRCARYWISLSLSNQWNGDRLVRIRSSMARIRWQIRNTARPQLHWNEVIFAPESKFRSACKSHCSPRSELEVSLCLICNSFLTKSLTTF